jgi:hypothetical protein
MSKCTCSPGPGWAAPVQHRTTHALPASRACFVCWASACSPPWASCRTCSSPLSPVRRVNLSLSVLVPCCELPLTKVNGFPLLWHISTYRESCGISRMLQYEFCLSAVCWTTQDWISRRRRNCSYNAQYKSVVNLRIDQPNDSKPQCVGLSLCHVHPGTLAEIENNKTAQLSEFQNYPDSCRFPQRPPRGQRWACTQSLQDW